MKLLYFILASLLLTSCLKADIAPIAAKSTVNTTKTDTIKTVAYSADTDISNPDYGYNGTTGPGLIQVTCKDCTALATIGTTVIPFIINADGVGKLKYTPAAGLLIKIALCPGTTKAVKADITNATKTSVYSYSGVITGNWSDIYISK
jgi:hypothetical protein